MGGRTDRNLRYCLGCNSNDIEDCFYCICVCSTFNDLRRQYIPKHYYKKPSTFKFLDLLKCKNKVTLCNVAKFIKEALKQISLTLP